MFDFTTDTRLFDQRRSILYFSKEMEREKKTINENKGALKMKLQEYLIHYYYSAFNNHLSYHAMRNSFFMEEQHLRRFGLRMYAKGSGTLSSQAI